MDNTRVVVSLQYLSPDEDSSMSEDNDLQDDSPSSPDPINLDPTGDNEENQDTLLVLSFIECLNSRVSYWVERACALVCACILHHSSHRVFGNLSKK